MQLRRGDSIQYNAHVGLAKDLRRMGSQPPSSLQLADVAELRDRTSIITGRTSAATRSATEALSAVGDARIASQAGDLHAVTGYAGIAKDNFRSAEAAVDHLAKDVRPRMTTGGRLLGLAAVEIAGLGTGLLLAKHHDSRR